MLLDKAFIKHLVEYELVLCPKLENGAVDIVKLVSSFGYIVTSSALPDDVIATLSISSDGKKVITANSSLPLPVQRIGIANEYELPSSEYEGRKRGLSPIPSKALISTTYMTHIIMPAVF